MKLFLVRHGQSLANKERKHQGREDEWRNTSLSNIGKTQAKKVADRLKDENFNLIYSSPLKRAKQTAEIINKFHNKKIIFDDGLKEQHDDTETKEEFIERVKKVYKKLIEKDKNILVIAHGGVILSMLAFSTENRENGGRIVRRNYIGNGNTSINILEKKENKVEISKLNCMKHLTKRYQLKHKAGLIHGIPYQIKPFVKEEINSELEKGDCRHKTELLKQLFEGEGFKVRKIYAVFDWKDLPVPKDILKILKSGSKMTHVLLEVKLNNKWIRVDFVWNRSLKEKNFPVTKLWNGKEDTKMITEGKINFYKTKEEAKKEKGINSNKEELHKFAEKFNVWILK